MSTEHSVDRQRREPDVQPGQTVRLEYYSWLARELIGAGEQGATIDVPLPPERTVRALLARLAAESERFRYYVFDSQDPRIKEYAALVVNGRVVELLGGLDARLEPGDHLLLVPGFSGG